jgi:hypothetical protein
MKYNLQLLAIIFLGLVLISCQSVTQTPIIETVQSETLPTSVIETVAVGTIMPDQITPPQWLNDEIIWVHLPWTDTIQLVVDQKIAVTPVYEGLFDWEIQYDAKVVSLIKDSSSVGESTVKWLWNAEQVGTTTIIMTSEPPPCDQDANDCSVLPSIVLKLQVEVVE